MTHWMSYSSKTCHKTRQHRQKQTKEQRTNLAELSLVLEREEDALDLAHVRELVERLLDDRGRAVELETEVRETAGDGRELGRVDVAAEEEARVRGRDLEVGRRGDAGDVSSQNSPSCSRVMWKNLRLPIGVVDVGTESGDLSGASHLDSEL